MSGAVAAAVIAAGGGRLLSTITITIGGTDPYGYDRCADFGGSIGNASGGLTFNDASGNSQTLTACIWNGPATNQLWLALNGIGVADADTVFRFIKINGKIYYRSIRNTYVSDTGAADDSAWKFNESTNPIGTSGSATLEIWA